MTILGIESLDLEVTVKYKRLTIEQCRDFLERYSELPRTEFIMNVLNACIANVSSEVKPALSRIETLPANEILLSLYNKCIMLNPLLDMHSFEEMSMAHDPYMMDMDFLKEIQNMDDEDDSVIVTSSTTSTRTETKKSPHRNKPKFSINKAKLNAMKKYLRDRIVGQDEAIDSVYNAIRRQYTGLGDQNRPIAVLMACGPSGVGKTLLAKELHKYLFNTDTDMVRIDCGEYQQKHENQKLLGSPYGYAGHEEGGLLAKWMEHSPATVFLLDEVEKAHPDLWHTFLKAFDEGFVTDAKGIRIDFRDTIFILTSNLGNDKVSDLMSANLTGFQKVSAADSERAAPKRDSVVRLTKEAVNKYFKIEFINRLDEIIIFNHLSPENYRSIADLEFKEVAKKLTNKGYNLKWVPQASDLLVSRTSRSIEGARGMKKIRRSDIEDVLAEMITNNRYAKGKIFNITTEDENFKIA